MLAIMRTTRRRVLAGQVVRDEIARMGKSQAWAADASGMAPSTLSRVLVGDERVQPVTLRAIEGALSLPDHLLDYIVSGDAEQIRAIGDAEMRPSLRRVILGALADIDAEGIEKDKGGASSG
jgi:hypothetical protein